jgi:hypothetical protein
MAGPKSTELLVQAKEVAPMPHPTGEMLRCDSCGAEIVYEKACMCPEREPKQHANLCCGKEMRVLGIRETGGAEHVQKQVSA